MFYFFFGVLLVVFLLICSNKIQLHGTISSHIIHTTMPNHNVCTWSGACKEDGFFES